MVYQDNVTIEVFTDIDVAFHDRVVCSLMNTSGFLSKDRWLEQSLGSTETNSQLTIDENVGIPFITDGDDLTIGKFITLLKT
jgi:hypothetical protein